MSQDRTFVPGMENTGAGNLSSMYSRTSNSSSFKGTIVPGMAPQTNGQASNQVAVETPQTSGNAVSSGAPVVGFLYSISNQGVPEYWPIMLGFNRIGRDAENEIILKEQTVSGLHASIMVQKKRQTGDVVAIVRLERGRTGVLVNGEEVDLRYGSECQNGDILTIGENYTFILLLVNAEASGLSVASNFMKVEESESEKDEFDFSMKTRHGVINTNNVARGTVALDGSAPIDVPGGTRYM